MNSVLYTGIVGHQRYAPSRHRFTYPILAAGIDLAELPSLDATVAGFGYNRAHLLSLRDRDYLRADPRPLADKLREFMPDTQPGDRIILLTAFRYVGILFNPVSFYFRMRDGAVQSALVEVNNTFRDRHLYPLPRLTTHGGYRTAEHEKTFHVSPFNSMVGCYRFRFAADPTQRLSVAVDLIREEQLVLRAWMRGKAQPLTSAALRSALVRHPLAAAATLPRILVQAARLAYGKRLPVHRRPQPTDANTLLDRGVPQ